MSSHTLLNRTQIASCLASISLFISEPSFGQNVICPQPSYTINSDGALTAFYNDAKECSIVTGDVTISGQFSANAPLDTVLVTLPVREIRGKLTVTNSNIKSLRSIGERRTEDSVVEESDRLRELNGLVVRDNGELFEIEFTDLQLPPENIEVRNNQILYWFSLTPETPPPVNNNLITLDGNWTFANSTLGSIELGFPTLRLALTGSLTISNTNSYRENLGDFSGLRSVDELIMTPRAVAPFEDYSMGVVTYGENQFGDLQISVEGGFKDLETAGTINLDQAGYTDISFPELISVESFEAQGLRLVDVNLPKLSQVGTLKLQGLGTSNSGQQRFGDRTGSRGRGWGLGRLNKVTSRLELWVDDSASAYDLGALNIVYNNNLTMGTGASVVVYSGVPEFSLANLRNVPASMGTLTLYGSRDADTQQRARISGTAAFENVSLIDGPLWLMGLQFDDFSFLENVVEVKGDLLIENNFYQSSVPQAGTMDGLEGIQIVGGDLIVQSMNVENCYALLPLVGWGTSPSRVFGSTVLEDNTPASCNAENLDQLRAEAAPGPFEIAQPGLIPGGVSIIAQQATVTGPFPVTTYEANCRATNTKSLLSLPGQPFSLPANVTRSLSVSFEEAGKVADVSIDVDFQAVDRSQLILRIEAPDYGNSRILWNREGGGTKAWVNTFTREESPELEHIMGTEASGEWTMLFSPGATTAALNSFQINVDSLYQSVVDANEVVSAPDSFVQMSIPDMPVGRSFQCDVAAVNDYGVRSTTESILIVTPPPISAGPTVLNIEETGDGVLVYFNPTDYWGSEWFGTVNYVATCGPGNFSSAPVTGSPALVEGLSTESDFDCVVSIDNIYETVTGPVFAYQADVSAGIPIWLLYEAARERGSN